MVSHLQSEERKGKSQRRVFKSLIVPPRLLRKWGPTSYKFKNNIVEYITGDDENDTF